MTDISTLAQLETSAQQLSQQLNKGDILFLKGDLGSGKTTFTQMLLKHLNYDGRVKSPTYAIYESYDLADFSLFHMDLYRLSNPEELYYLAIDEIFSAHHVVLIEWPEKGQGVLPEPSYVLSFELKNATMRTLTIDIT